MRKSMMLFIEAYRLVVHAIGGAAEPQVAGRPLRAARRSKPIMAMEDQ
jgi:hypothetical protein